MPFEVGQFASDYEILGVLGKGGMGRVYRVRNVISNRMEAMKVLLADVAAEAELGDRFSGEIRTLARLDHPNIAKFHTAFKFENQLVMVMEFVEGFTLSERSKQSAIPLEELLSYITQTLAALSYAHQAGVIHRDIKPANIMVTPHGIVKLMDFGIAKSNIDPLLTRPGTTMGSMLYMSPEQVRGTTVDARSDIYSVGVLLYELSAGRRPFEAENTFAILEAQLNAPPRPPIELNPSLPKLLNDIILTAMDKEPMHRFQSADAFRNALESIRGRSAGAAAPALAQTQAAPRPPSAPVPPPAIASPPASAKKGNRGLWMALGAVACVCVLAGGAYLLPHFWKSDAASKAAAPVQPTAQPVTPPVSQSGADATPAPASAPAAAPATPVAVSEPTPSPSVTRVIKPRVPSGKKTVQVPAEQPTANAVQPQPPPVAPPSGPTPEQLDAASDDLMKLRSRADAIRDSLDRLRSQQAASGLGMNPDTVATASRMQNYLQAADRALQGNNLESAHKNMDRAETEITKLEAFFGR
jgi:serine/threonine-protein kinase